MNCGFLSLSPALVAICLAFVTRDSIFSILMGVVVGLIVAGQEPISGFMTLLQNALGTADYIWVMGIEVFIGAMIAFFQKTGAIDAFSDLLHRKLDITKRFAQTLSVFLGIVLYFSDYFSPLFMGNIMRPITDRLRISREKLAYYCDCTAAPKCTIIPFSTWGVYVSGLLVGLGSFVDVKAGLVGIIKSVPFQFYGFLTIAMVVLNAIGIIPDFGPMRKAEQRAFKTGKVVADGDKPMISNDLDRVVPRAGWKPNFWLHFMMPAIIVVSFTLASYFYTGSVKLLEAFGAAVVYQAIILIVQRGCTISELTNVATQGIKSVTGAILILALAYCINELSKMLGTAQYIISITESWMTPSMLLVLSFIISALMAFFAGTSWGVFAIMIPVVIPLALDISAGTQGPLVYAAIAAVMGGGCFGDHCSPLSDTTILSSLGAGADHVAHVKTQLPYALGVAVLSSIGYLIVGAIF